MTNASATDPGPVPWTLAAAGRNAWALLGVGLVLASSVWLMLRLIVVVVPVVVALLLTAFLLPVAKRLQAAGIPKLASTWFLVLGLLGIIAGSIWWIVPSATSEAANLSASVSDGFTRIEDWLVSGPLGLSKLRVEGWGTSLRSQVGSFESQVAKGALAQTPLALELVAGTVLVIVLTFFFVKDGAALAARLSLRADPRRVRQLARTWAAFSGYAKALVVNAAVNAIVIGAALALLGVPLALPIAVVTFAASFVPIIGAIVAGTMAALVALVAAGPGTALVMVAVTVLVHHLEGYVVGPIIIGRHTGLHPVVLILALIVGVAVGGIAGGFLAGPIVSAASGWLAPD